MKRQVFFSFHYFRDAWRASQVRNIGVMEGNAPVSDNDWETVKRGGDAAIQRWIDNQLQYRSCTIVLIGQETAGRPWIDYEIQKSWAMGKGVLGIYIHNLKNREGVQTLKGANPFAKFNLNGVPFSSIVKTYCNVDWEDSTDTYRRISENLDSWVEEAIRIRKLYN